MRLLRVLFYISLLLTAFVTVGYVKEVQSAGVQPTATSTPFLPSDSPTQTNDSKLTSANHLGERILVRVSHYWPPWGGPNCSHFVEGQCLSEMASGERWQDWKGHAIACPPEFPFGTQILIGDRVWICLDRGGAIQIEDGAAWVDMLIKVPLYDYGEVVEATILPDKFVLGGTE